MVLDNLRFDLCRVMEPERARVHNCRDVLAQETRADGSRRPATAFSRLGQPAADAGNALDLFRVLAIPDHLVGESAGRDELVRGAQPWWLGHNRFGDRDFAVCVSVFDLVVTGSEKEL